MAYEIVEHTADVGIRATAPTLSEAFRETTLGLLEITGTWMPNGGDAIPLTFEGADAGSLLVDWLGEILYLEDAHDSLVSSVEVDHADDHRVSGSIRLTPRGDLDPEGTAVKAITYHQLAVEEGPDGWHITVFVDV